MPRQVEERPVLRVVRVLQPLAEHAAEVVVEPELGAAVVLRLDGLEVPLQQPLRIRERAVLLDVRRRRHEEDLCPDLAGLQLARLDLRAVVPERRRLDLDEVADDEPVELREREPVRLAVRRADRRIFARDDVALDGALQHLLHGPVGRVVVVDPRQVVEAEVVRLGRGRAPPRLQQRHDVRVHLPPPAGGRRRHVDVVLQAAGLMRVRHRQVAREDVVERRDVGRALDRRVPAQRHDPAAGAADVAEQQLDDRGTADVLHADRVLGPADRVREHARALAAGVPADLLAVPDELFDRAAARVGDELRRVARVVALQELEDAARVLQRLVGLRRLAVIEMRTAAALADLLALVVLRVLEALLALARGAVRLHALVAPRRDVVLAVARGPSPRRARRAPRCPGTRR